MKIKDEIIKAVEEKSPQRTAMIVDLLRFSYCVNFEETFKLFNRFTGIARPDFDSLLYLANEGY